MIEPSPDWFRAACDEVFDSWERKGTAFVVKVDGKVRTRHATAMESEVEAARLRSLGWRTAHAVDEVAARAERRSRQSQARSGRA